MRPRGSDGAEEVDVIKDCSDGPRSGAKELRLSYDSTIQHRSGKPVGPRDDYQHTSTRRRI